uniref:Uncharacterized protein n=1 Tax=Arundo donax TaxID=35708 RepID=A0A0A9A5T6_ARUDO
MPMHYSVLEKPTETSTPIQALTGMG